MYARGRFGIEYTPTESKPDPSGLGRVLCVVAVVIVAVVVRAIWTRMRERPSEEPPAARRETPPPEVSAPSAPPDAQVSTATPAPPVAPVIVREADYGNRPVKVRNLLLRLAEAERTHDVEMAISTIEQLRATPGAADLDDTLARRLGVLNCRRLFARKSAQWTTETTVKRGDSATRIAYEHGSTLASLRKLNGNAVDRLQIGQRLTVMNHPRFNLVVSRRSRTADLMLNGKFFKRYYLADEVRGAPGSYETPERFRSFCAEKGIVFKPNDRDELEMLLPKGTAAFIREI